MTPNGNTRATRRIPPRHARRSRTARPAIGVVLATVLALTALVLTAAPASAHDIDLAGLASCQTDGTWTVNWTLINFGDGSDHYMLVRSAGVDQGTLAGITSNPSYNGTVDAAHPDASQGGGTIVSPGSSGGVAFSSPGLPASQAAVTLTVTGFWNFDTPSGPVSYPAPAEQKSAMKHYGPVPAIGEHTDKVRAEFMSAVAGAK